MLFRSSRGFIEKRGSLSGPEFKWVHVHPANRPDAVLFPLEYYPVVLLDFASRNPNRSRVDNNFRLAMRLDVEAIKSFLGNFDIGLWRHK